MIRIDKHRERMFNFSSQRSRFKTSHSYLSFPILVGHFPCYESQTSRNFGICQCCSEWVIHEPLVSEAPGVPGRSSLHFPLALDHPSPFSNQPSESESLMECRVWSLEAHLGGYSWSDQLWPIKDLHPGTHLKIELKKSYISNIRNASVGAWTMVSSTFSYWRKNRGPNELLNQM